MWARAASRTCHPPSRSQSFFARGKQPWSSTRSHGIRTFGGPDTLNTQVSGYSDLPRAAQRSRMSARQARAPCFESVHPHGWVAARLFGQLVEVGLHAEKAPSRLGSTAGRLAFQKWCRSDFVQLIHNGILSIEQDI